MHYIKRPKTLPNGAYCPRSLRQFISDTRHMNEMQIARALRVTVDRIHYLMSDDGYRNIITNKL